MPRSLTVNYARMLRNDAGTTALTVTYIVGSSTTVNGVATNIDIPEATINGLIVVPIAQTDTEAVIQQNLVLAMCQAEGLNPAQGDMIFGTDGTRLV
jgi:hypothetical protein